MARLAVTHGREGKVIVSVLEDDDGIGRVIVSLTADELAIRVEREDEAAVGRVTVTVP